MGQLKIPSQVLRKEYVFCLSIAIWEVRVSVVRVKIFV